MTVAQLIAELQKMPADAIVWFVYDSGAASREVFHVTLAEDDEDTIVELAEELT